MNLSPFSETGPEEIRRRIAAQIVRERIPFGVSDKWIEAAVDACLEDLEECRKNQLT